MGGGGDDDVKRFTRAEVKERCGRGGAPAWIIYKNNVYDVTGYVPEHPGGDVILEEAGSDATKAFEDIGHSKDARTVMVKLKIGELVEEEKKYDANGKKRKIVVPSTPNDKSGGSRSCLAVCTCGLLG